ncbi:MAG: UDP-N-acetylglucosamine 1-carboxyvinyltransferase [Candidatus Portnoybacteria bacterium]|nr:UDP-N-acetylglucosamine 1-carboxyvinyltransferase [Candidatus Portnoybacteria bacterium]
MEQKFAIFGGRPLRGEIEIRGAKNAATPILAACLLTSEPCVVDNLPLIEDVFRMLEILQSLGVEVEWLDKRRVRIRAKEVAPEKIDQEKVCQMRSSILILGALLARCRNFKIAPPGGCIIGSRPVETHFAGLAELGAEARQQDGHYFVTRKKMPPAKSRKIILQEFSVTATENILMAAALMPGMTQLRIAAAEPHVQDLVRFLNKMGAKIKGGGTHELEVRGVKKLKGTRHFLIPDPIEAGTFIVAAAATRGKVAIKNVIAGHLDLALGKLKEMGVNFELTKNGVTVSPTTRFCAAKIQTLPYPGIPTDLQAPLAVLCTQAEGRSLIHDPMYEGRFKYLNELVKMGADATVLDPHRAVISGPTPLYGKEITSFDLRAGATLIIAALVADGQSQISEIYQVDRGYEKIEERLAKIGADIKRI